MCGCVKHICCVFKNTYCLCGNVFISCVFLNLFFKATKIFLGVAICNLGVRKIHVGNQWVGYWCAGCLDVRCWNDDDPRTEKGLEEDSVQLIFRDVCGLRCVCESRSVWWMWRVAVFPEMCVISMFLFGSFLFNP
jgi:hypothetical protein